MLVSVFENVSLYKTELLLGALLFKILGYAITVGSIEAVKEELGVEVGFTESIYLLAIITAPAYLYGLMINIMTLK